MAGVYQQVFRLISVKCKFIIIKPVLSIDKSAAANSHASSLESPTDTKAVSSANNNSFPLTFQLYKLFT